MEKKAIDLTTIQKTAMKVLTSPSLFFKEMPKSGGFVEPLIFMVAMGVISGLLQSIFSILGLRLAAGLAMGVASIILFPILIGIFGFVGAAIIFAIWKIMGSRESYETAYRCAAYLSVLTPIMILLGVIPYIGSPIGIVIYTFFLVIASVEVHQIPSQKAWLVFGIIGAVFIIVGISSEITARRVAREAARFQKEMEGVSKAVEKQAEETKKALEEIQKQFGK